MSTAPKTQAERVQELEGDMLTATEALGAAITLLMIADGCPCDDMTSIQAKQQLEVLLRTVGK